MTKRILSLALLAVMALTLVPAAQAEWIMYVSPASGTTVNLRTTPEVNKNNLIAQVPYGTPLTVKYITNGWACIDYNVGPYGEGFMMVKYLTYDYKAPTAANQKRKTSNNTNTNTGSTQQSSSDLAVHYGNMNEQFRSFRLVAKPFIVYGKPERVSGYSNMRYAPNEKATLVRRIRQNEMLTVIGETDRWYQVTDPQTGITGYISRFYVTTNPN